MQKDTVKLLRECTAGAKMGESALTLALEKTKSPELRGVLESSLKTHAILGDEAKRLLFSARQKEKEPPKIAQMMSDTKIKTQLAFSPKNTTVASLMTDGCNTGAKSLARAINHHPLASPQARNIAQHLITTEDSLRTSLKKFL